MHFTNPSNLLSPQNGNDPQVTQIPESQLQDGHQLLRNDLSDVIKTRVLQFQIAKSVLHNEQEGITTSLLMRNLNDQSTFVNYQENTKHFAASINKMAVTHILLQDLDSGARSMNEVIPLPPPDQRLAGAGKYDTGNSDQTATLRELLFDLLNRSGNTAVKVLVNSMGGAAAVNNRLAQVPEIPNTRLIVLPTPGRFYLGDTTAKEALFIMEQLYFHGGSHAEFAKNALATNIFNDFGVRSQIGDTERIQLTNKLGLLDDPDGNNRHDIGIIHNWKNGKQLSYAIMSTSPSESDTATDRAEASIKEMGRNLLRYAGDTREDRRHDLEPFSLREENPAAPKIDKKVEY